MKPKSKANKLKRPTTVGSSDLLDHRVKVSEGKCLAGLTYPKDSKLIPSNDANADIDAPDVTLKVNNQVPMSTMRRGKVRGRLDLRAAAKVVTIAALVALEVGVIYQSHVGLLVERNLNNVLRAEVVPFVVHEFHSGVVMWSNEKS